MSILATAYPRFYAGTSVAEQNRTLQLWATMFADDDYRIVCAAVKAFIATDEKGFPPHIGAIKAAIRRLTAQDEMSESEAWTLVRKAISNGYYGAKEEFDKLPPVLQKLVGGPEQLREWSLMDSATVQSVVASNIQRAYRTMAARKREWDALPEDVRQIASQLGAGKDSAKLTDGNAQRAT